MNKRHFAETFEEYEFQQSGNRRAREAQGHMLKGLSHIFRGLDALASQVEGLSSSIPETSDHRTKRQKRNENNSPEREVEGYSDFLGSSRDSSPRNGRTDECRQGHDAMERSNDMSPYHVVDGSSSRSVPLEMQSDGHAGYWPDEERESATSITTNEVHEGDIENCELTSFRSVILSDEVQHIVRRTVAAGRRLRILQRNTELEMKELNQGENQSKHLEVLKTSREVEQFEKMLSQQKGPPTTAQMNWLESLQNAYRIAKMDYAPILNKRNELSENLRLRRAKYVKALWELEMEHDNIITHFEVPIKEDSGFASGEYQKSVKSASVPPTLHVCWSLEGALPNGVSSGHDTPEEISRNSGRHDGVRRLPNSVHRKKIVWEQAAEAYDQHRTNYRQALLDYITSQVAQGRQGVNFLHEFGPIHLSHGRELTKWLKEAEEAYDCALVEAESQNNALIASNEEDEAEDDVVYLKYSTEIYQILEQLHRDRIEQWRHAIDPSEAEAYMETLENQDRGSVPATIPMEQGHPRHRLSSRNSSEGVSVFGFGDLRKKLVSYVKRVREGFH